MAAIFVQYIDGYDHPEMGAEKRRKLQEAGFVCLTNVEEAIEVWALFNVEHYWPTDSPLHLKSRDVIIGWIRREIRPGQIHDARTLGLSHD